MNDKANFSAGYKFFETLGNLGFNDGLCRADEQCYKDHYQGFLEQYLDPKVGPILALVSGNGLVDIPLSRSRV